MSAKVIPCCGAVEAACRCEREADHEGAHRCACGGSWSFAEDGSFEIHSLPNEFELLMRELTTLQ